MLPVKSEDIETMIKELAICGIAVVESFVEGVKKIVKKKENNSIEFSVTIGNFSTSVSLLKVHK